MKETFKYSYCSRLINAINVRKQNLMSSMLNPDDVHEPNQRNEAHAGKSCIFRLFSCWPKLAFMEPCLA